MPGPRRKTDDSCLFFVTPHRDQAIAQVAGRQHGVIARRQLVALGISERVVAYALRVGRLHRVHHGVYAVGHSLLGAKGRWMAATLACGPTAALSHATAAALWEIRPSASASVDVTVRTPGGRSRPGLRIHRMPSMRAEETTTRHGIPVTTPERTLLDLASTLTDRQLERALDQAEIQQLIDYRLLDALMGAHASHRGAGRVRAALDRHTPGTTLTRSELEERFLELCRAHGLPRPSVNARAAGLEVDFLFTAQRFVAETDGWHYHRTRTAFERDRRRDGTLTRAGYRVLRFTHNQVEREPSAVAATLAAALGADLRSAP